MSPAQTPLIPVTATLVDRALQLRRHHLPSCIHQKAAAALAVAFGVVINARQHNLRHRDVDFFGWA